MFHLKDPAQKNQLNFNYLVNAFSDVDLGDEVGSELLDEVDDGLVVADADLHGGVGDLGLEVLAVDAHGGDGPAALGHAHQHEGGLSVGEDRLGQPEVLGLGAGVPAAGVQLVGLLDALGREGVEVGLHQLGLVVAHVHLRKMGG